MNKREENENYNNQTFEDIKHIDEKGIEYWNDRELQIVLNYDYKGMNIIELKERTDKLINQLLEVWEDSVKATHTFLSNEEIENIKKYVPQAKDFYEQTYGLQSLSKK